MPTCSDSRFIRREIWLRWMGVLRRCFRKLVRRGLGSCCCESRGGEKRFYHRGTQRLHGGYLTFREWELSSTRFQLLPYPAQDGWNQLIIELVFDGEAMGHVIDL